MKKLMIHLSCVMLVFSVYAGFASAAEKWITFEGKGENPKHVVLISGDEEYRSEEALPQLAKILSTHHGFKCTVLFAIDPETGFIQPNYQKNIPGLVHLKTADLMVIATRFRNLPDSQMQHIDRYLKTGRPVIGIRTATHAFRMGGQYARYSFNYNPQEGKAWRKGFGGYILGETWVAHHGHHRHEATRGLIADGAEDHPITNGIEDGDIWGPTDVYAVRLPLPGNCKPLVMGAVTKRIGKFNADDIHFGMRPSDPIMKDSKKNNPMMPVAWIKTYQVPGGEIGTAFTTTMGSSSDLLSEGTRRMIVNAALHLLGVKVPEDGAKVDIVGDYHPTQYGFHDDDYFIEKAMKPEDFK